MKHTDITTRGLSPLEIQVAEMALAIKDIGDALPSNLAKKFYKEVWFAASEASRYYLDISGRKNYLLDDVISFVKDFPVNTLFTSSDVHEKLRHKSVSIEAALRKLSATDLDLDLCAIHGRYIKPQEKSTLLNVGYEPNLGKKWRLELSGEVFLRAEDSGKVIQLSKEFNKKALDLLKAESKRFRRKQWSIISDQEIEIQRYLSKEVVHKIVQDTFQRMHETLLKEGYLYLSDVPVLNCYHGPRVVVCSRNPVKTYEVKLIDENIGKSIYGSGDEISFRSLEESCFYNSGLVAPNGFHGEYFRYDPVLLREARKRKLEEKLSSRQNIEK